MSRWFRHYAGMMRDEKLVSAAVKTGQPVERVVWLWGAILESAAEINDNGKFSLDTAEAAYFLRADKADLDHIIGALQELGRLSEDRVVKWGDRQFTSDQSADRTRAYRERHKERKVAEDHNVTSGVSDGAVTSPERHRDAPETETNTELETDKKHIRAVRPKARRFEEWWGNYPKRLGANPKAEAQKIYEKLIADGVDEQVLLDGLKAYCRQESKNIGTPYIPQATKFLRRKYWDAAPGPEPPIAISSKVFVPEDHPAWPLWQAIKKTASTDGRDATGRLCRGWHFESEYPPSEVAA